MLTEINTTTFSIRVRGIVVLANIPSRQLAEATVFNMKPEDRAVAEIVTMGQFGELLLG